MWGEWAVEDFTHQQNAHCEPILKLTLVCRVALVRIAVTEFFKQGIVLFVQLAFEVGHSFRICAAICQNLSDFGTISSLA